MKHIRTFAVVLTCLGILGPAGWALSLDQQDASQVEIDSIQSQFARFQQALASKDSTAFKDLYSIDAVSLLQNQPPRKGGAAIEARWKASFAGPFSLHLTSQEIRLSPNGQDAYQYGTFEIVSTDPAASLLASGKWLYLWRKESDRWRIVLEMDNFDAPKAKGPIAGK